MYSSAILYGTANTSKYASIHPPTHPPQAALAFTRTSFRCLPIVTRGEDLFRFWLNFLLLFCFGDGIGRLFFCCSFFFKVGEGRRGGCCCCGAASFVGKDFCFFSKDDRWAHFSWVPGFLLKPTYVVLLLLLAMLLWTTAVCRQ